jgi:hypothetical protein
VRSAALWEGVGTIEHGEGTTMSGSEQLDGGWPATTSTAGTTSGSLLTPGTCSVVALVLAVLVLMGNNLMVTGSQAIVGNVFASASDLRSYLVTTGIATLVPVALSLVLARRALSGVGVSATEATLARAAMVLALVAAVYSVLTLIGGFVHHYDNLGF